MNTTSNTVNYVVGTYITNNKIISILHATHALQKGIKCVQKVSILSYGIVVAKNKLESKLIKSAFVTQLTKMLTSTLDSY